MRFVQFQKAFTLLELVVAIAIFALISAMAYAGLNNILITREQTDEHSEQLRKLQMAMMVMQRDIEQIVNRGIRNEYGEMQYAVIGNNFEGYLLELTRGGWFNPASQARSTLQRVAYAVNDKKLIRVYWRMLDRADDSQPIKMEILDGVDNVEFRYFGADREWHTSWPDQLPGSKDVVTDPPKAIEVTLETQKFGKITRLFRVTTQI